jgi:hypothetical protein
MSRTISNNKSRNQRRRMLLNDIKQEMHVQIMMRRIVAVQDECLGRRREKLQLRIRNAQAKLVRVRQAMALQAKKIATVA